jgi:hypothetical protein
MPVQYRLQRRVRQAIPQTDTNRAQSGDLGNVRDCLKWAASWTLPTDAAAICTTGGWGTGVQTCLLVALFPVRVLF